MLKAYIDLQKDNIIIDQSLVDIKDISDTLSILLERIIIDTYIKPSPKIMDLPPNEQKSILLAKKAEILNMIDEHLYDYDYVYSKETSDIFAREDFFKNIY